MKIDKRVIDLLKANCVTFGWNVNKTICAAMRCDLMTEDNVEAADEWSKLLDQLISEEKGGPSK